jgi:iron complex outermembrane receptor protein
LSLLGRVTYQGETTRVFNFGGGFEPEQTYGAEFQVDVEVGYRVWEGIELFVGASNLLDEYPDESIPDISYFGNLPYDVLPPIGFNGRFVYGGVRASF